ncbi:helix-turn-helix domain-containing protein [Salinarimonas rosea]|uniref:helix-turn-helix domain-containing protein n=1 Tax=Salinarimonas rosea TaxID=552063 RepID=UPI0004200154|nr:cupin domain-containing protein [Salinarimonas rosea]
MNLPAERLDQTPSRAAPRCGVRIRELRRKAGLTLQALSDQAGISVGFLSQVERDKATPSLGTLAALGDALGVDIDYFVAAPKPLDAVSRAGERPLFAIASSSLAYERLTTTLPGGALSALIVHLPVGYTSEVVRHTGEEFVLVLEGRIRQTLGDVTLELEAGDSLHYMGETPHAFANVGDEPARLLWTGTSPRLLGKNPDLPQREPRAATDPNDRSGS